MTGRDSDTEAAFKAEVQDSSETATTEKDIQQIVAEVKMQAGNER